MKPTQDRPCTAFLGPKRIAHGTVTDVAAKLKKHLQKTRPEPLLIFDDVTSSQIELDLRGPSDVVVRRLKESFAEPAEKTVGPGRPKLGVISREIGLLPRHWEWLALQPGGASVTLRKLVEEAKKKNQTQDLIRQAQDATYKFMTVIAGDLPLFEEALRLLYAKDQRQFAQIIGTWPKDIRQHIEKISVGAFTA